MEPEIGIAEGLLVRLFPDDGGGNANFLQLLVGPPQRRESSHIAFQGESKFKRLDEVGYVLDWPIATRVQAIFA
ncbi:hypothetical protein, partial [Mesorhizobium sp. M4B.F.Ca.ET.203.01.1.1]|uniref:hypothetical protein n=1 Tax=Mesorhizobium sp. M4B.F.Ca.ET.203.01.1.1 TaxID=2563953 RepID=UPI001FDF542F